MFREASRPECVKAEVGLGSTDTIKFWFRHHLDTEFKQEAFATEDRLTGEQKNLLSKKGFTHQREGRSGCAGDRIFPSISAAAVTLEITLTASRPA
jgi:hypothetical protein